MHDLDRHDRVMCRATGAGAGVGLLALMVTWIVAARIAEAAADPPTGPVAALIVSLITGTVVAIAATRRLADSLHR